MPVFVLRNYKSAHDRFAEMGCAYAIVQCRARVGQLEPKVEVFLVLQNHSAENELSEGALMSVRTFGKVWRLLATHIAAGKGVQMTGVMLQY